MPTTTPRIRSFEIQVGDRGRLVLPARARRELGIDRGSRLLLTLEEPGVMKLTSAKAAADKCMGMLRGRAGERSVVDELIAERREAAKHE